MKEKLVKVNNKDYTSSKKFTQLKTITAIYD